MQNKELPKEEGESKLFFFAKQVFRKRRGY
jgi:hypothetical protein